MVSEVFSRMVKKAEMGYISCFRLGMHEEVTISHFQFANDMMIFCDADMRQLGYLRCILRCFEVVFRLKIDLAKSEIFQVGAECDIESLAWILGYKIGNLPSSYLGLPLGTNNKSKRIWESVIERFSSRLDAWKVSSIKRR